MGCRVERLHRGIWDGSLWLRVRKLQHRPAPIFGTEVVSRWHEASSREGVVSSVGEK
jgi:hypothetical protein